MQNSDGDIIVMISSQFTQFIFMSMFALVIFIYYPPTESHIIKGDEYYRSFNNEQALAEYELAYKDSPSDYYSLMRLVRIQNDLGRINLNDGKDSELHYRTALSYADTLLRFYPDSATSHFWYALAKGSLIPFVGIREKIQIGKEVKQHIQASLQRDSTFAYPYIVQGIFERTGAQLSWLEKGFVRVIFGEDLSGSLKASEDYLHKALKYDSTNSFAYYELFWTYKAMGDTTHAIVSLHHVLGLSPKNLREKNQQEEAQKYLTEITLPSQLN